MRPLLATSNTEVIAESSSTLILPSQTGTPKAEHQSFFHVQISGPKQPLDDIFMRIYKHLDQLREGGHHEATDEMDKSLSISSLVQIAGDDRWKPFDTV